MQELEYQQAGWDGTTTQSSFAYRYGHFGRTFYVHLRVEELSLLPEVLTFVLNYLLCWKSHEYSQLLFTYMG